MIVFGQIQMLFALIAGFCSASDQRIFRGAWSALINLKSGNNVTDGSRFQLSLDPVFKSSPISQAHAVAIFSNSTYMKFGMSRIHFSGVSYGGNQTFFLFNVFPSTLLTPNLSYSILRELIEANGLSEPYNISELRFLLENSISANFSFATVACLSFNLSHVSPTNDSFEMGTQMNGSLLGRGFNLSVSASLFDVVGFITEGKLFGVAASFGVVLTFYAWLSLYESFQTSVSLSELSLHSFILHIGCDFSYALFILDLSMASSQFSLLYTFLFMSLISIYFGIQMKELAMIWRSHNDRIGDADINELRVIFFRFFGEVAVLMSLSSIAMSSVFEAPVISLIFLSSSFVPQIIYSATSPLHKSADTAFVILISIARCIPLSYFTLYHRNIAGTYSPLTAILTIGWTVLQVSLVLLQNKFGGSFFLPKSMKPSVFDYHSTVLTSDAECAICMNGIGSDEDFMVTPCHHSFHSECLRRWMEEQLVCPICRAPLPPCSDE